MSPLDSESATSTTTKSTVATSKATSIATSSSAARALVSEPLGWSVWGVFYTGFLLLI
jgi:hypothetical protein